MTHDWSSERDTEGLKNFLDMGSDIYAVTRLSLMASVSVRCLSVKEILKCCSIP